MKTFQRNIAVTLLLKVYRSMRTTISFFIVQLLRQRLVRGRKYNRYIPGRFPQQIPTECEKKIYYYYIKK